MSNTPHTLADEFPDQLDVIHKLKVSTPAFAQLLKDYDEVNDDIHLAETNVKPVEHLQEVQLRKRRLEIKDAIAEALARSSQ
ncbi:YdcH family protein [Leptospira interrogans]